MNLNSSKLGMMDRVLFVTVILAVGCFSLPAFADRWGSGGYSSGQDAISRQQAQNRARQQQQATEQNRQEQLARNQRLLDEEQQASRARGSTVNYDAFGDEIPVPESQLPADFYSARGAPPSTPATENMNRAATSISAGASLGPNDDFGPPVWTDNGAATAASGGAGATAAASVSAGGNDPYGPESEPSEQVTCEGTRATTETACMAPGTKGMDPGEAVMFTAMMNQMTILGTQIASAGKNMAQQCRLQADVSKLMGTLNGVKAFACGKMISRCNEVCNAQAKDAYQKYEIATNEATKAHFLKLSKSYQAQGRSCSAFSSQVYAMGMGAMQHGVNIVQNQQCAKEAEALANMPMPTFSPIAMPNPTDCTDPNNQSFACFCTREVNKSSPMCAGFNGGGLAGGGASPTGPSNGIGSSVATPFLGTDTDGDGIADDPVALQQKQNASGGDGFSPGGGSAPGGGGLGGFGGDDGGMGAPGDPRSAITGTSGGTGSGLGGGGGGGGGLARNNGGAGASGNFMDKFNLKRFLPGSKYKARGIAGMSVKSVDGITGPMGPSIWEKATRQYQEQIQKQNVIVDR